MEHTTSTATSPASAAASSGASAATSSPAGTGTTTPVSTPVTDGAGGAGALDSGASINAMVEAAKSKGFGEDLKTEPVKTEPVVAASEKKDEPAAAAAAEKKDEPAAGTKQDEHTYSLEQDGFIGAKDMAAKLKAEAPNLSEETRNAVMANSRLAETGAAYREMFASPAEAKVVIETAQEHAGYVEAFNAVAQDVEKGTTAMINKLLEASALRDKDGKPIKNADGTYKTDGTASKFLTTAAKRWFAINFVNKVKASGDENLQAALDLVMESVGMRPSTAAKTQDQDPAIAARKADLDAQEKRINDQKAAAHAETLKAYQGNLDTARDKVYSDEVGKLLGAATGLDDFTRKTVERELGEAVKTARQNSVAYKQRSRIIRQQPPSPERHAQEVSLVQDFLRDNLVRIATPILNEAGVLVSGKLAKRAAAQAAREESSRSDIKGGAAVNPANGNPNPAAPEAQIAAARDEWKKANPGKEPNDSDLNIFMMLNALKAKGLAA